MIRCAVRGRMGNTYLTCPYWSPIGAVHFLRKTIPMSTYFLSPDFSLDDLPHGVALCHRDNFEHALGQRHKCDDAWQDAQQLKLELGPGPGEAAVYQLKVAWTQHRKQKAIYEAMAQDAMEKLIDDYPNGFNESYW